MRNKYIKKIYKTKKGLTLIEIIISIAILGIISVSFLSMFSSGLSGIFKSGQASTSHYQAQNKIESNISSAANNDSNVTSTNTSLQLNFSGSAYTVNGRKVDVNYNYGNQTRKLTSFTVD